MSRRVSLTLSDEEYEVLKAYAKAANLTPTTVVHKLFTELVPVFSSVVIAAQLAEEDKKASLIKLQSALLDGIHTATGISSELQKDLSS